MTNASGREASGWHFPEPPGISIPAAPASWSGKALAAIACVIPSSRRFLADLIDRIVNGIRCLAPLMLGLGCQSTSDAAAVAPPVRETVPAPADPAPEEAGPRQLGQFTITFYYVI